MLSTTTASYMPSPATLTEAMQYADMISKSSICPRGMRGRAADVLVCIQYGCEIGLRPLQALQGIAVINGRPVVWGDAALALVQQSDVYDHHSEGLIKDEAGNLISAYCKVKRKNSDEYTYTFTVEMAKQAKLWGKNDVWSQYPDRMLQMRARAFAIRDQFADALKGLAVREEVEDYSHIQPRKTDIQGEVVKPSLLIDEAKTVEEFTTLINNAQTLEELKDIYFDAQKSLKHRKEDFDHIIFLKDLRKSELEDSNNDSLQNAS
jgi:hypothetical protein